ncbi:MAG: threonine synthase [Akkermansiaceae bacterium]|jgi:threonine synthase|nr:threonine synthase [Akkermansiaceae bacterium]
MFYRSTNDPARRATLKEAVLDSLPPDGGLYLPERLLLLDSDFWSRWRELPFPELGAEVAAAFFGDDVPRDVLAELTRDALSFEVPLAEVAPGRLVLELFHGPTLAFKDFGARFMARLMGWLARDDGHGLTVLVATSGDTGGAVAHAFHGVAGIRVVILYPSGKVSGLQEKQLTTLGGNITALEVDGSFDDCQRMVKAALARPAAAGGRRLASANSINIARLVPQCFYYLHAARLLPPGVEPVFVTPSGNLGNLTAGLLAERIGLRVRHFIAALNANDAIGPYLGGAPYQPRASIMTCSNAMDVGAPSNFARMLDLFGHERAALCGRVSSFAASDEETLATIRRVADHHGYQLDPHGAVGWHAAERWLAGQPDDTVIILETAHPAKFPDIMERALGPGKVTTPERLARLADLPKSAIAMPADDGTFLRWLANHA